MMKKSYIFLLLCTVGLLSCASNPKPNELSDFEKQEIRNQEEVYLKAVDVLPNDTDNFELTKTLKKTKKGGGSCKKRSC